MMRWFFVFALFFPSFALAWSHEGHRIVADIAELHLTPEAKRAAQQLLALEHASRLADIATWADETKNKTSGRWHYVNLPRDANCQYVGKRDCADGHCIIEALNKQHRRYKQAASPEHRLKALRYLVHLVGDIHQPLHASFSDDKGGNRYQVYLGGKGSNLHRLWDVALVSPPSLQAVPKLNMEFNPQAWAEESCRIASAPEFYPRHKVPKSYLVHYEPVAQERLMAAGLRLAALLNGVHQ